MDEMIYALIIGIACVVIGTAITWTKKKGYDDKVTDLYEKYRIVFTLSGALIKSVDEKLYNEMEEAINKMTEAYNSPNFTPSMLEDIIKECQDVFDRVQEIIDGKTKDGSDAIEEPTSTVADSTVGDAKVEEAETSDSVIVESTVAPATDSVPATDAVEASEGTPAESEAVETPKKSSKKKKTVAEE